MQFEYHKDNLCLKVLDESYAPQVLDFYRRNRSSFEPFESEKPAHYYTIQTMRQILSAEYNGYLHGKYIRFYLFDKTIPDTIIGTVSFSNIRLDNMMSCIIGYRIDAAYQNLGYGRRMLTHALQIMVLERNMHRIEAYILPTNTPSIRLAQSVGFLSEGTAYSYVLMHGEWKDHLRFVYIS